MLSLNPGGECGWLVKTPQETLAAAAVVLSCPAHRQAGLVAALDPALATALASIPYSPAVVVALGYRRTDVAHPLDGFGSVMPQRLRGDVLGAQWCSSIFPERAPVGCVLLRIIAGGWHRQDVVAWDDDRLLRAVRQHLRAAIGIEAAPVFTCLSRWPQAIPQYHLGHLARVRGIEELASKHAGLFLTGNAFHGVAMNDCTEQALVLATRVARHLAPMGRLASSATDCLRGG